MLGHVSVIMLLRSQTQLGGFGSGGFTFLSEDNRKIVLGGSALLLDRGAARKLVFIRLGGKKKDV